LLRFVNPYLSFWVVLIGRTAHPEVARLMKTPLLSILKSVFGYHHHHLSRVFTIRRRMYQVCVECGREFEYSWESMRSIRPSVAAGGYAPLNTVRHGEVPVI